MHVMCAHPFLMEVLQPLKGIRISDVILIATKTITLFHLNLSIYRLAVHSLLRKQDIILYLYFYTIKTICKLIAVVFYTIGVSCASSPKIKRIVYSFNEENQ